MTSPTFEYDVCLSFAGEQRSYVERVANSLTDRNVRVFYDLNEQATLWGRDLYEHLDDVYRKKARYCIIFISQDYVHKVWTNHERRSAQARAIELGSEYILPARFDDTEVPGIRSTVGFIDLSITSPEDLAGLAAQKLSVSTPGMLPAPAPQIPYSTAPATKAEQDHLIAVSPDCWEYFLFAGTLLQGKTSLSAKRRDYELGYASYVRILGEAEVFGYIAECMRKSDLIRRNIMKLVDSQVQQWAFGARGVPGDVENIIHLGRRFIDSYAACMDWAADLRGTVPYDDNLNRLYDLASLFLDLSIKRIEEFIDGYARKAATIPDLLAGGEPGSLSMELILEVDQDVLFEYEKELKRARKIIRR